jgi:glutathione peroxidase-family protein
MAQERETRSDGPLQNQGSSYVLGNSATDPFRHSQWNFEKFLVDKNGKVINRWASTTTPQGIDANVEKLLAE